MNVVYFCSLAHALKRQIPVTSIKLMIASDINHRLARKRFVRPADPVLAWMDITGQHDHIGGADGFAVRLKGGGFQMQIRERENFHSLGPAKMISPSPFLIALKPTAIASKPSSSRTKA